MGNEATNFIVADRGVLVSIIESLKKIDVRGFDSMDRLVGCVCCLQAIAKQTPSMPKEPAPKDGTDKEEKDG